MCHSCNTAACVHTRCTPVCCILDVLLCVCKRRGILLRVCILRLMLMLRVYLTVLKCMYTGRTTVWIILILLCVGTLSATLLCVYTYRAVLNYYGGP